MAPIEKKINEYLQDQQISEETKIVLNNLLNDLIPIEKTLVNNSYFEGYTDKERGKSPNWNLYSTKYIKITFGKITYV